MTIDDDETQRTDEHGRRHPPIDGDELATLTGFLEYQRATLRWKCARLDEAGFRAGLPPTSMTLGGLLKHLAWVEDHWFRVRLLDRPPAEPWADVDWESDPDWEFSSAAHDGADELRTLWEESCERSRAALQEALSRGGLDQPVARPWPSGEAPSLRWVLVHMIEEYARHNGHADLLRQSVDGETGE